jgi:fatty-acyl-CoA synthase
VVYAGDPVSPEDLRAYLANHVAHFWLPEYWASLSELPRTGVGKVDKKALRDLVANGRILITKVKTSV